jgi:hypothetical protein
MGERMTGISKFTLGDLAGARDHFERLLSRRVPHDRPHISRYQSDTLATVRGILARTLWVQGFPDQAMHMTEVAVEEAGATGDAVTLCEALYSAGCRVPLWIGDLDRAERSIGMLLDQSTRFSLPRWGRVGRCYEAVLTMKRGDVAGGLRLLRSVVGQQDTGMSAVRMIFLGDIAESLCRADMMVEGLAVVESAIKEAEALGERWMIAELLRINGELVLLPGGSGAAMAETYFRRALDWARRQGALSWELRAATSLAGLLRDQGRAAGALALLQSVYDRFTEGFDTADLKAAKALLGAF